MKKSAYLVLFLFILCHSNLFAQPELDTTFNSTGKLVVSGMLASVRETAVQSDNKIVFVAGCGTVFGGYPICVGRLNENGTLDTAFGGPQFPGFALTRIDGTHDTRGWSTSSVAIQNDGKIVVTGFAGYGSLIELFAARYNSNGTLDSTFGTNGLVQTTYLGDNFSHKILILPDGKILVVGYIRNGSVYKQLLIRLNPNGTLDQTFSGDGFLEINIPGHFTRGSSAAIQADGKIVTGGSMWTMPGDPNPASSVMLIRFNPDGTFDTTFDGDGIKTIVTGSNPVPTLGFHSVAIQSDGRILALDGNLYRFNTDGSPDTSFDEDGMRPTLNADSLANGMIVTPSGKITVVGERRFCNCTVPYDYRVSKYLPDGSPDTSFSGDGYLEIDISSTTNEVANTTLYDMNGRILIGGFSATGVVGSPYTNATWSFARLIASPVQNVGFSGRVLKPDGKPVLNAIITIQNGSEIIGVGRTNPFGYFHLKNIPTGQTYTLSTRAKGLNFTDRSTLVDDEISNFLIVGAQQ